MRKVLGTMLLAGLFLLMLSALVVTPEDAMPPPPLPPVANVKAAFVPAVSVTGEWQAIACAPGSARQTPGAAVLPVLTALLPAAGERDSNGRILRHGRYENSVYQVFRPEVAGG